MNQPKTTTQRVTLETLLLEIITILHADGLKVDHAREDGRADLTVRSAAADVDDNGACAQFELGTRWLAFTYTNQKRLAIDGTAEQRAAAAANAIRARLAEVRASRVADANRAAARRMVKEIAEEIGETVIEAPSFPLIMDADEERPGAITVGVFPRDATLPLSVVRTMLSGLDDDTPITIAIGGLDMDGARGAVGSVVAWFTSQAGHSHTPST